MSQKERTELIREIKELLILHYGSNKIFDKETIKLAEDVLKKSLQMSLY